MKRLAGNSECVHIWLRRPYGYDKHIYIIDGSLDIGDKITLTNGYYDETHKVVNVKDVEIVDKPYKEFETVGIATGHTVSVYLPME